MEKKMLRAKSFLDVVRRKILFCCSQTDKGYLTLRNNLDLSLIVFVPVLIIG